MSLRLRDLIKEVRSCRTAADERAVIQKESAAIRQSFRAEEGELLHRNVAKMLYIHMMGFPTYWGQFACLKLISSNSYADKRIGYLGVMLLLDEKQEILTLVTQCLKNDLAHPNHFISGLALVSLGNISSAEIARDLAPEVEKLLGSKNPYVRKKAALCAIRTLRKCPDLMENFVPRVRALLAERNHGVLVTGVKLMTEVCEADPVNVEFFRKLVPTLVRMLKQLSSGGSAPEYDVSGVTDPFLQVNILRLLRALGRNHAETTEEMADTLAQVATNTDHSRNVGNCVLYECVLTIFEVDADNELRALAITVLARFLLHRDNNIRYVALSTLARVVVRDAEAVQRHRNHIVDCLKDPDISIRKRALELIYSLVNEGNIQVLAGELINFLSVASAEFRPGLAAQLCVVAEKFAPNDRWRVDTILKVMQLAGQHVPDETQSNLISSIISGGQDLQGYAVQKMFVALTAHPEEDAVVSTASWVIGEFGDVLVRSDSHVTSTGVVEALGRCLASSLTSASARAVVVTALAKLTDRLSSDEAAVNLVRKVIAQHSTSADVEVQQRACEFLRIMQLPAAERSTVLARMPPMPERKETGGGGVSAGKQTVGGAPAAVASAPADDLLGDLGDSGPAAPAAGGAAAGGSNLLDDIFSTPAPTSNGGGGGGSTGDDLLGDLGLGSSSPSPAAAAPAPSGADDLLGDLLGGGPAPTPAAAAPAASSGFVAYDKNGCKADFKASRVAPNQIRVDASFTATAATPLSGFDFKVAHPQYLQLQMQPASSTVVPASGQGAVTQPFMLLQQDTNQPVIIRIRLEFQPLGGQKVVDVAEVNLTGKC